MKEMVYNEFKEANNIFQNNENRININKNKEEITPHKQKKKNNRNIFHKTKSFRKKLKNNSSKNTSDLKSVKRKVSLSINNSSKKKIDLISKDLLNSKMKESFESSKKNENDLIYSTYIDKNKEK
jgi:hypothetical protein